MSYMGIHPPFLFLGGFMAGETGGFNLGNAYGSVVIDVSGVSAAMQQAKQAIENGFSGIGNTISSIGDKMSSLGGAISTFSAPLLAAGGVGLKAAADFDMLLKQIEIFGNVAPDQMSKVSEFALKMGADTKFSSSDAAAALLELLKSGQSLEQAMKTLPDVLNLAATGNLDLASASGIVSSGLAIYKLKAEDAGRVSNALARAANATRADVGDLGQALTNAGPVAAQFGLSIEDTAAILGVFSNNGIMGAEAGTQLKSMLLNMSRPTEDVQGAFEQLGVSLYDGNGNARDFNTVIKELDKSLDKLPVKRQNELMQTLGGSYGIVGLNALRAAGGIDTVLGQMQAAPDAGTVATSFMETFAGAVESAKGSLETLLISGLTPFMNEVAGPFVKRVTEIINSITEWTQQNPELTKQIVEVLAVVAVLGPALMIAGAAFSAIGTIIGVILSPIGLVAAAIAGLVLAFQTNFLGIRDAVQPIVDWFTTVAMPAVVGFIQNTVIPGVQRLIDIFVKIWSDVSPFLANLANWFISDVMPTIVHYIEDVVIVGIQKFIDVLVGIWTLVQPTLQQLYDWFITVGLPAINSALEAVVRDFIKPMVDILAGIWVVVGPILEQFKDWFVTTGLPEIQKFIQGAMDNFIKPLINLLKGLWDAVRPGVEGVFNWFRDTFSKVGQFIQPIVDLIQSIIDKASQALDWLRQLGGGAPSQTSSQIVQSGLPANMQSQFPGRDIGGPGMAGMAYQIGSGQLKNEVYIPGADGQFVSGFVDLMKSVASGVTGGSSGGDTINVMLPEAALANPAAAHAIGQDFGRGILDEMRARGVKGMRG